MLRRPTSRLLNLLWTCFAALSVGGALLATGVRLALPHVDKYRSEVETWLSAYLGQTVVISDMTAEWAGWTPTFSFQQIELRDSVTDRTITRFEGASIDLDLIASFRNRTPVPGRLSVSGIQLNVVKGPDGTVTIEGVSNQPDDAEITSRNTLVEWLLAQRNLTVNSAYVRWIDQRSGLTPTVFPNATLNIRSDGVRRQISGRAQLPSGLGNEIRFALDTQGDLLAEAWTGELYLAAQTIDLPNFLAAFDLDRGRSPLTGKLGFELWSRWSDARVHELEGDFSLSELRTTDATVATQVDGRMAARRDVNGPWLLGFRDVTVSGAGGEASIDSATILMEPSSLGLAIRGEVSALPLSDLLPQLAAIVSPEKSPLKILRGQGSLENVRFSYRPAADPAQRFYLVSDFNNLALVRQGYVPGVYGLSGRLRAWPDHGVLSIDSQALRLDMMPTVPRAIALASASGRISWQHRDGEWRLGIDGFTARNPDARLVLEGRVTIPKDGDIWVDGRANVFDVRLEQIHEYLPLGLRIPLPHYLDRSVVAGRIPWGGVILRGPIAAFPFDQREGKFEIRLHVADGVMQYAQRWPPLEDLDVEILMAGRELVVRGENARTGQAHIDWGEAGISDVLDPDRTLKVEGKAHSDSPAALDFLDNTPLREQVGNRLRRVGLDGDLALDLSLTMPLKTKRAEFDGRLELLGNRLRSSDLDIELTNTKGHIDFTRQTWSAESLQATWQGQEVTASMASRLDQGIETFELSGSADPEFIRRTIAKYAPGVDRWSERYKLVDALSGAASWQATLQRVIPRGSKPDSLLIYSDLAGLAVEAPYPLGKPADSPRDLRIVTELSNEPDRVIAATMGQDVRGEFHYRAEPDATRTLLGTYLALGESIHFEPPESPTGLWVDGRLTHFALSEWLEFLAPRLVDSTGEGFNSHFDMNFEEIEILGQNFDNLNIKADVQAGGTELYISSPRVSGHIHQESPGSILTGRFERVILQPNEAAVGADHLDPRRIPPLDIRAERFVYEDLELGTLTLATEPSPRGLDIVTLNLSARAMNVTASGHWTEDANGNNSRFDIAVSGDDLGQLLSTFNYDTTNIVGGKTVLDIDAGWSGSPAEFSLERLNGQIGIDVEQGRFLDIDPKSGRLFGLLSLQMLPRRLSLDFRDLYQAGFSFDRIVGTFSVAEGNAYTNALEMLGPAARIVVSGRVGLADEDYDQIVTVSPQISDSLPVASAMFGPAGVGVGAAFVIAGKVFKGLPDSIDSILKKEYAVTGPWHAPVVEQIVAANRAEFEVGIHDSRHDTKPSPPDNDEATH